MEATNYLSYKTRNFLQAFFDLDVPPLILETKKVDLDRLIYPERSDVKMRIKFLEAYDSKGKEFAIDNTNYFDFYQKRLPDEDPMFYVDKFIELYESVKDEGFKRNHLIQVVETDGAESLFLPPEYNKRTRNVEKKYILVDGAHRLSILKHLGYDKFSCFIVYEPECKPPDYTLYLEREGLK